MDDESSISDDSLTAEKWRELGSADAVEKSRSEPQTRTRNQMAGKSKKIMTIRHELSRPPSMFLFRIR